MRFPVLQVPIAAKTGIPSFPTVAERYRIPQITYGNNTSFGKTCKHTNKPFRIGNKIQQYAPELYGVVYRWGPIILSRRPLPGDGGPRSGMFESGHLVGILNRWWRASTGHGWQQRGI